MKKYKYTAHIVTCILILVSVSFIKSRRMETFEDLQDGSCNCCKCGWTSCELCAENRARCCGDSMAFNRYSFKPEEAQLIDPLYPFTPHVKYKSTQK